MKNNIPKVMSYEAMKQAYNALTAEQQAIVYNLTISLMHLNARFDIQAPQKRTFGQFAGRAKAIFADDWEMTEDELCSL
ncbi:MAG: hypothetical protein J6T63_00645 [Bacteroidales bacterium]|nr:hypothetical protein [Bacteroidales bacterium]